jgi:hypothetical protein
MKKLLLFLSILIGLKSFSQTPTMDDVLNRRVTGILASIQLENGAVLKIGDTLTIGTATGNGKYNFLAQNMICMGSSYTNGVSCIDGYYSLGSTAGGSKVIIKEIRANFRRISITMTHAQGYIYGTRILSVSSAINSGEIRIDGFLSSDEALSELKKAKDKLDLGLITQEEFNTLRENLSKFIK